jgi:hypothetical protein
MLFNDSESRVVNRRSINNLYDASVEIEGYEELVSEQASDTNCISNLNLKFYDILKKKNRIINCRYVSLNSEMMVCISKILTGTGKKPNLIFVSNYKTLDKIKLIQNNTLSNFVSGDGNKISVITPELPNKEFCIFSYTNNSEIGITRTYDKNSKSFTIRTPIYKDSRYNDTHFNYYYGLKLHD